MITKQNEIAIVYFSIANSNHNKFRMLWFYHTVWVSIILVCFLNIWNSNTVFSSVQSQDALTVNEVIKILQYVFSRTKLQEKSFMWHDKLIKSSIAQYWYVTTFVHLAPQTLRGWYWPVAPSHLSTKCGSNFQLKISIKLIPIFLLATAVLQSLILAYHSNMMRPIATLMCYC